MAEVGSLTQVPLLPRNIIIPLGLLDSVFPQVTRVVSIGQDETSVGNPKATISVIYGNSDSSLKVTITIDAKDLG